MDLSTLVAVVRNTPSLQSVSLEDLLLFFACTAALKSDILLVQPSDHAATISPGILPNAVNSFLTQACHMSPDTVQACWTTFKDTIWHINGITSLLRLPSQTFQGLGFPHGLTARTLYPPDQFCPAGGCPRTSKGMRMMHAEQRQGVLYTASEGPVAVHSIHLSCEACRINYHHNFKVVKGQRFYYGGIPDVIQISEHQFVERRVAEMWMALMDTWSSATACARFYNMAMSCSKQPPPGWQFGFTLTSDHIWSTFLMYCLLEDTVARQEYLVLKHTGEHKDRFTDAIRARNQRMRLHGQSELTHFCDKCTRWFHNSAGQIEHKSSAVVTDGICIGHPCCSVHNCQVPLQSTRDRFCPSHAHLVHICAIVGCDQPVVQGQLTCPEPEHQKVERAHEDKGQSRFQLRERLQRARAAHPSAGSHTRALAQHTRFENEAESFILDADISGDLSVRVNSAQDIAPIPPPKKLRAKFTRSRTHNEQIVVAPCGIILARDTMFGAEGVASVAEFLKRTFRIKSFKPDHIFFDNNCTLAQHVKDDPFFADIGLTVDVFHFKSKHKATDTFCQTHCNPAAHPELIGADGKGWFFNSSAAEQTNVWLGGYHAICREMTVDKYDFFLDEMILRRNRVTRTKLEAQGCRPGNWPIL